MPADTPIPPEDGAIITEQYGDRSSRAQLEIFKDSLDRGDVFVFSDAEVLAILNWSDSLEMVFLSSVADRRQGVQGLDWVAGIRQFFVSGTEPLDAPDGSIWFDETV